MSDHVTRAARSALIAATAAIGLGAPPLPANAEGTGDAARGARLFLQCQACHAVRPDQKVSTGPTLYQVVGRKAGAVGDYAYSPGLKAFDQVWTAETLDPWLKRPSAVVPGTKMAFAGVAADRDRADIIAYLETLR